MPVPVPPAFDRNAMLRRLGAETFDVVVVGGGITGAGAALDAVTRGLSVALVERDDFGSGTSSKSSKMVHGGLRYLQNRDIRLVYDALHERQRLFRNAPHLVRLLPFLIPMFHKGGVVNPKAARAVGLAMWGYDLTGGWRIGRRHERLTKEEVLAHVPTLRAERVHSGYLYFDCGADDARLVLTIARTAAAHGAAVANRVRVTGLTKDASGRVTGVEAMADGRAIAVKARSVVNAAGVWADDIRTLDEGVDPDAIRPAKGVHITVPWEKIRNDVAVTLPVPNDRRSVFVVRWGELTYIGTTDTDYDGSVDNPMCTTADVEYLLGAVNAATTASLTADDVVGTWAGLRPLLRSASSGRTADLSRRHGVATSPSGVVSVTGGKLTTYREMAEDAIDAVLAVLGRKARCHTRRLRLLGADGVAKGGSGERAARRSAIAHAPTTGIDEHLRSRYGSEDRLVKALVDDEATLGDPLVPGLPYIAAEAVHAVRHEMAVTLDDVLSRRTRARLLARDASAASAERVARIIAPELGWTQAEIDAQVRLYRSLVADEQAALGPSPDPAG